MQLDYIEKSTCLLIDKADELVVNTIYGTNFGRHIACMTFNKHAKVIG